MFSTLFDSPAARPELREPGELRVHLHDGSFATVRRLQPGDSMSELTAMLHAAFSRLCRLGLNCGCVSQTEETTRSRLALGDAFVAVRHGQLVGTVTLCHTDPQAAASHYRKAGVASLRQLGVAPALQSCGLGSALIALGERWAAAHGYRELALDTPKPASHLLSYYAHHGFHGVETVRLTGRNYVSVVLRKGVSGPPAAKSKRQAAWPAPWPTSAARTVSAGR